jgi:hypothetical protein
MPSLSGTAVTVFLHLYSLDFSNILTKTAIERLADADEYEAVREVQVIVYFYYHTVKVLNSLDLTRNTLLIMRLSSPLSSPLIIHRHLPLRYPAHLQALGMQRHWIGMSKG